MNRQRVVSTLLIMIGLSAVGFGILHGDEGTYSLDVEDSISESQIENDTRIIKYEKLDSQIQDAFVKSLEANESVSLSQPPEYDSAVVVNYNDTYYPISIIVGDASHQTAVTWIFAGGVLVLIGLALVALPNEVGF